MILLIALAIYGIGVAICYGILNRKSVAQVFVTKNTLDRVMIALLWPAVLGAGVGILFAMGFTGLFGGGHHD